MRFVLITLCCLVIVTINAFHSTDTCHSAYYPSTKCLDKLDHYECICGQGQLWNGYSCVADAVDSRLVFNGSHFPSYIKLDSKTFPRISELTISMWIRIWSKIDLSQQTILYYEIDDGLPVLLVSITYHSRLHVEILNHIYDMTNALAMNQWHHLAIVYHPLHNDEKKILINGTLVDMVISSKISHINERHQQTSISGGGDFFVGQSIRTTNSTSMSTTQDFEFDTQRAFYGEIVFLNLWQRVLSEDDLHQLATDCHIQRLKCGDAVAWMDFVNDIKGGIKIHWPAGIFSLFADCPTRQWLHESCDNYCRKLEGPHCKNESQLSIIWQKVIAGQKVSKTCPGRIKNGSVHRTCQRIEQIARWTHVDYSECTHPLINAIDEGLESTILTKEDIIGLRDKCAFFAETISSNLTSTQLYSSIDLILLIEQIERLTTILTSHFDSLTQWYSSVYEPFYLVDINATLDIHRYLIEATSNLIDERYSSLWIGTNPLGNDFIRLLTSLQRLTSILAQILTDDCHQFPGCSVTLHTQNIDQTIHILNRQDLHSFSYENLETNTKINFINTKKNQHNNRTTPIHDEKTNSSVWYSVSITNLRTAHRYIPNLRLGRISKYDNLNSHVISIDVKLRKSIPQSNRLSILVPIDDIPIHISMGYLKHDNISGNQCVHLDTTKAFTNGQYKTTLFRQWSWQSSSAICDTNRDLTSHTATCSCLISNGTFAITSDMFDPNWRPLERRLHLLVTFSYIGSLIHMSLALLTLIMLIYLRTHSSATYIHKHYSFVLCCSQVTLILSFNGVPYYHSLLCRPVAYIAHFFILSSYCWLMNEAFNLYIQITYSTHPAVTGANAALSDAASKYRFLGMGYILPFCIVVLLASIKQSDYFMPFKLGLCFLNLDDWFKIYFIPISGIIFITIMVMIFSAKQHHEISYTKNEKANEVIVTYTGGIWSQLFLVTVNWSLVILPYFFNETILQLLHGFFNGLQGGFLFLSFFVFNDEIRRHYRDRRRQLRRIQLMEVPYRNSTAESEGQQSAIIVPAVTQQALLETPNVTIAKIPSVTSVVSNLLIRKRQGSLRRNNYEEMRWTLRRKSSNAVPASESIVSINNGSDKDINGYRITVV